MESRTFNHALCVACREGDIDHARELLETIHIKWNVNNALYEACLWGHVNIARLLVQHGANEFAAGLRGACYRGKISTVKLMIEYGADNFTEGVYSARNLSDSHYHVAEFLISKGASNSKHAGYEQYCAWKRCVLALPFLCEDVLRMVT